MFNNGIHEEIHEEINGSNNDQLEVLNMVISQKWYTKITLLIEGTFKKEFIAMIDSGADLNVIQEGLIPTKYFQKTSHSLSHAGGGSLNIRYKLSKAYICKNGNCIPTSFLLAKDISGQLIFGLPFIYSIYPLKKIDEKGLTGFFNESPLRFDFINKPVRRFLNELREKIDRKNFQLNSLKQEISFLTIEEKLANPRLKRKIDYINNRFSLEICSDHPNAFWNRKKTCCFSSL